MNFIRIINITVLISYIYQKLFSELIFLESKFVMKVFKTAFNCCVVNNNIGLPSLENINKMLARKLLSQHYKRL